MVRYPHLLYASVVAESTRDSNGDWVKKAPTESEGIKCRYEAERGNPVINGTDGSKIDYSGIAYFPKETSELQVGTSVVIKDEKTGTIVVSDTIKRFTTWQTYCEAEL